MEKITDIQKKEYPNYILYVDYESKRHPNANLMEANKNIQYIKIDADNALDAIRKAEVFIHTYFEYLYLCDIYEKTDKENERGCPIYHALMRTRVMQDPWDRMKDIDWHLADSCHGEYDIEDRTFYHDLLKTLKTI